MKTQKQLAAVLMAVVIGVMATGHFAIGQNNPTASRQIGPVEKVDQILGQEIKNGRGETIGKINNLAVDLESGRVLYAIVDVEGGNRVAIPPGKFSFGAGQTNLVVNVTRTNLTNAPRFQGSQLGNVGFAQQVYNYFGQPLWWEGPSGDTNSSTKTFGNVHGASQLIGAQVKDVSNQDFGRVRNLVVSVPTGRVLYVAFSPSGDSAAGNTVYLLPPSAFTPGQDGKTLVTGVDKAKLQGGPHFNSDQWPDVANPSYAQQVYQYYGKQPYFDTGGQLSPTSNR
ncbi:MAG: PRC-barrel domain containing protein [Pedosphaera sp.]|nr:PRC-barrel domain containing protein [Pedosphaera sp.]